MTIDFTTKQNRRLLGNELQITNETHTIGIVGVSTHLLVDLYPQVKLIEIPLLENPSSVVVYQGATLYTETTILPQINQYVVDYAHGYITFHTGADTLPCTISYKGRGSEVDAIDINDVQAAVNSGGGGGASTASNIGSGTGLYAQQIASDLQFKSLTTHVRADSDIALPAITNTSTAVVIPVEKYHTWVGTQAQYNALGVYDANTVYHVTP